ncbi:MAG TPA: cysteine synthase A, partial [Polyangiaceae bacterium]|nr:cysteine synthase A [Polyangiaceae bacterium]
MTRPAPHPSELIYDDSLELVHDTPLLELGRVGTEQPRALVLGKMENANPGGSVKDRIALSMIDAAERSGSLRPGGTVIEPTSGNTGIGLALVCRRRGYRCVLTMPESMSLERRQLLEAYGAELVLTPEAEQMEGAAKKALELAAVTPGSFVPHQFDNPANPQVHYEHTGPEIVHALQGQRVDAFVAAVGTGGTVSGVGRYLKEHFPECRVIAVEPETSATLSRGERGPSKIQGIAAGFVPENFHRPVVDEIRTVSDRRAYEQKRELGRKQGILVGLSAGANVAVALDVARELGPGRVVVTVLCDTGERYFSL